MTTEAFAAMARNHWKKWLPRKWKALMESGQAEAEVRAAAQMAQQEKLRLMKMGAQEHEADEIVRAEFLLLKPEPEADAPDAEDRAREKEYARAMRRSNKAKDLEPDDLSSGRHCPIIGAAYRQAPSHREKTSAADR
jgi:hypothetical protein